MGVRDNDLMLDPYIFLFFVFENLCFSFIIIEHLFLFFLLLNYGLNSTIRQPLYILHLIFQATKQNYIYDVIITHS